jgi:Uma2 family endonuclease
MSIAGPPTFDWPPFGEPSFPVRRFTVDEYLRLAQNGILTEDDRVELLEGLIVPKMPRVPRHDAMIDILVQLLIRLLPAGWFPRDQKVLLTVDSAPEPDVAVTRGQPKDYWTKHPTAADVSLVIEVSESSLAIDRKKRRIYARAGVPAYWIVDLDASAIEVYTEPNPQANDYQRRDVFPLAAPRQFSLADGSQVTLPLDTALQFS